MKKLMIILSSLFLMVIFSNTAFAQPSDKGGKTESKAAKLPKADAKDKAAVVWKTLGKITFKKEYDEIMGFKVDKPVFSKEVQALEGKVIEVKGYITL